MGSHGIKNQPRAKMGEQQPESLIVVDVGNHHVKFARLGSADISAFPDDLPVLRLSSTRTPLEELAAWLPAGRAVWCVASVSRPVEARLADWVADQRPADNYLRLTNDLLPIEIRVEQPERVGTDRLLAALAAASLGTNDRPAIVIDAGSAITVDLVAADGAFEGGAILPGFEMMATALAQQTDQLPLIEPSDSTDPPPVVGKSTVQAIRSGLFWSHIGAVRELVERISAGLDAPPEIFVAGGDAAVLAGFLDGAPRVIPNLVFQGILIAYRQRRR
jgi:type III pantothenate kinase